MSIEKSLLQISKQIISSIVEEIAKDGIDLLDKLLVSEGITKFEHLKHYEVLANITNNVIEFEIVFDIEGIDLENSDIKVEESDEEEEPKPDKTFRKKPLGGVQRVLRRGYGAVDARKRYGDGLNDGRRRVLDARETSSHRDFKRKISATPKSMLLTRQGKLIIKSNSYMAARKEEYEAENKEFIYKSKQLEGIIGRFANRVSDLVANEFSSAIRDLIEKSL